MFCSHFTSHHSEFVYLNLLSSLLCQSHLVTYPYQFISLINQKGLKKIDLTLEEHRRSEEISSISPETKKSFYRKQHGKGFFSHPSPTQPTPMCVLAPVVVFQSDENISFHLPHRRRKALVSIYQLF